MPATRKTIAVLFSTMTFAAAAALAQNTHFRSEHVQFGLDYVEEPVVHSLDFDSLSERYHGKFVYLRSAIENGFQRLRGRLYSCGRSARSGPVVSISLDPAGVSANGGGLIERLERRHHHADGRRGSHQHE